MSSTCDVEFGFVELLRLLDLFVPWMAHLCNFLSDFHLFLNQSAWNLLDNVNDTLGLCSGGLEWCGVGLGSNLTNKKNKEDMNDYLSLVLKLCKTARALPLVPQA